MLKSQTESLSEMRESPHKSRFAQHSEVYLKYLQEYLYGFKNESARVQYGLLEMIMQAHAKFRQHSCYADWSKFSSNELRRLFGRGKFVAVNNRFGIFTVHTECGREDWSKVEGRTKAYRLTDKAKDLKRKLLDECLEGTTRLLTGNGDIQQKLPQAVEAKGEGGQTRKGWKVRPVRADVPINQPTLSALIGEIEAILQGSGAPYAIDRFDLELICDEAKTLLHLSKNRSFPGIVPHRYVEHSSGRLYARGFNLQNSYRIVRQAALSGCFDYDIENCHFSIVDQMAAMHGYKSEAIKNYLTNKKLVRESLAADIGVPVQQIKVALIKRLYGAIASTNDSLANLLGQDKAQALYRHPLFLDLSKDLAAAKSVILKSHPVLRHSIKNMRGLTMNITSHSKIQQLAHLLQGVEAAALEAAHQTYPDEIILLLHDGWVSTVELDRKVIESAIFQATGYHLEVPVGKVLSYDLDGILQSVQR